MSSAVSCLSAAWSSVSSMPDILGTTGGRVGGFTESIRATPGERGVSRGGRRPAALQLAAHQAVEDVGLAHQHLVEAEDAEDADEHARCHRRSRRPVPARARGCGHARSAVSVARVRNTSSAASRVSRKWWIFSGSYSGMPELDRGDGGDGAGEADERRGLGWRPGSGAARRRRGRARLRPRSTAPRAPAGRTRGTAR